MRRHLIRPPERCTTTIHVGIGWLWDGGIDVSTGGEDHSANLHTVAEVLPWLRNAIAEHYPDSKYNVERLGGTFVPKWFGPAEWKNAE